MSQPLPGYNTRPTKKPPKDLRGLKYSHEKQKSL
jgi:hypothetical protein